MWRCETRHEGEMRPAYLNNHHRKKAPLLRAIPHHLIFRRLRFVDDTDMSRRYCPESQNVVRFYRFPLRCSTSTSHLLPQTMASE
jgi:hypothetical protein